MFRNIGRAIPPQIPPRRRKSGAFLPLYSGTMTLRREKHFRSISALKQWTFPHWGILCVLVHFFSPAFLCPPATLSAAYICLWKRCGSKRQVVSVYKILLTSIPHTCGHWTFPHSGKKGNFSAPFLRQNGGLFHIGEYFVYLCISFSCDAAFSGSSQHGFPLPLGAPQQKKSDTLTGTALYFYAQ